MNTDFNLLSKTHVAENSGNGLVLMRPKTPPLKSSSMLGDLSVKGSYKYSWNTDCLSFELSFNKYLNCNSDDGETLFKYTHRDGVDHKALFSENDNSGDSEEFLGSRFSQLSTVFKAKYYTWHRRDKYNEGLHKYFTIFVNENIIIEFDDTKYEIPRNWLDQSTNEEFPEMPEVLKPLVYSDFCYAHMDLGKNIYQVLCQIYKHKTKFDL